MSIFCYNTLMIQFLYGENIYFIEEELRKIERDFAIVDSANMNLSHLNGADLTYSIFCQQVDAMPFLAEKRLIVIKNFLLEGSSEAKDKIVEKITTLLKTPNPATDIIFAEMGVPDKRTKLFKTLLKSPGAKEYTSVRGYLLHDWMKKKVEASGFEIDKAACNELEIALGSNLPAISNELDKISLYIDSQGRNKIEVADIKNLIAYEVSTDIFALVENIARKNERSSLDILDKFISQGENEQKIMAMIVYQFRTLIIIKELLESGQDKNQISKISGLHPFVVTKSWPMMQKYSWRDLTGIYALLADYDHASKTGELDPSQMMSLLVVKLVNW